MNKHYIDRYYKFINSRKPYVELYKESHHIKPRSLGGSDNEDNIISLSPREHYIAHWMLARAYGGPMWYAFWMMNTEYRNGTSPKRGRNGINSRAYEEARIQCSKMVSERMKDHVVVYDKQNKEYTTIPKEEYYNHKDRYETTSKGKAVYKLNGELVMLPTNAPEVLTGEAVHYRVGYKHSEKTKEKMSTVWNTTWKNHRLIYEKNTGKMSFLKENEPLPPGWEYGTSKNIKKIVLKPKRE